MKKITIIFVVSVLFCLLNQSTCCLAGDPGVAGVALNEKTKECSDWYASGWNLQSFSNISNKKVLGNDWKLYTGETNTSGDMTFKTVAGDCSLKNLTTSEHTYASYNYPDCCRQLGYKYTHDGEKYLLKEKIMSKIAYFIYVVLPRLLFSALLLFFVILVARFIYRKLKSSKK